MANTIELTAGIGPATTRMVVKHEMERFGAVDVCHMGNRDNPKAEPPWVRFSDPQAADKALEALKAGQVVIDGMMIEAQKSTRRGPPLVSRDNKNDEIGSRELFMQRMRGGGGRDDRRDDRRSDRGRGRSRSRSRGRRSRSRRGGRSRSRGRKEDRDKKTKKKKSSSSSSSS